MALRPGSGDGMGCGGCSLKNISISVFSRDSVIFARESELSTPLYGLNLFLGFFFSGGGCCCCCCCCWYWNHSCRLVEQRMIVGQGSISLLTSCELISPILAFKISFNSSVLTLCDTCIMWTSHLEHVHKCDMETSSVILWWSLT